MTKANIVLLLIVTTILSQTTRYEDLNYESQRILQITQGGTAGSASGTGAAGAGTAGAGTTPASGAGQAGAAGGSAAGSAGAGTASGSAGPNGASGSAGGVSASGSAGPNGASGTAGGTSGSGSAGPTGATGTATGTAEPQGKPQPQPPKGQSQAELQIQGVNTQPQGQPGQVGQKCKASGQSGSGSVSVSGSAGPNGASASGSASGSGGAASGGAASGGAATGGAATGGAASGGASGGAAGGTAGGAAGGASASASVSGSASGSCSCDDSSAVAVGGNCFPATCKDQVAKLAPANDSNGKKTIPIKFDGSVNLVGLDLEVVIKFSDNNEGGITKKDNSNSCIEAKLIRYYAGFLDQQEDSSTITSTYDDTEKMRIWKFKISAADIATRLNIDIQPDKVLIQGYYGIKFTASGVEKLRLNFNFGVAFNLARTEITASFFKKQAMTDTAACATESNCVQQAITKLQFCTEATCASPTDAPTLIADTPFYVKVKISQTGFEKWQPTEGQIIVTGDGVVKTVKAEIVSSGTGFTIYKVTFTFIANNLQIKTVAGLKDPSATGTTRFLRMLQTSSGTEVSGAQAVGSSTSIDCIKKKGSTTCPSQAEVEAYNPPDCGVVGQTTCESDETSHSHYLLVCIWMILMTMM